MSDDTGEKRTPLIYSACKEELFAWIAKRYAPEKAPTAMELEGVDKLLAFEDWSKHQ